MEESLLRGTFLHQPRVGGGQHDLTFERREVLHQVRVALGIELARHVVQQEERRPALRPAQVLDLADLERQHHGARLALARVEARGALADEEAQIVGVWSHAGVAALLVARLTAAERLQQALCE